MARAFFLCCLDREGSKCERSKPTFVERHVEDRGAPALLVLEDGTAFEGTSLRGSRRAFGEICFQHLSRRISEVITDPSYAGQIITMTYPQIGNYGVNLDDCQSEEPALRGLVVRDMCATPSNWRSEMSPPEFFDAKRRHRHRGGRHACARPPRA